MLFLQAGSSRFYDHRSFMLKSFDFCEIFKAKYCFHMKENNDFSFKNSMTVNK